MYKSSYSEEKNIILFTGVVIFSIKNILRTLKQANIIDQLINHIHTENFTKYS